MKAVRLLAGCLSLTLVTGASVAGAAYEFPLLGSYTQNAPCKGDGSDPNERQVKISPETIVSKAGTCTFRLLKREGNVIQAQVECNFPSGPLIGDVVFTMQGENTVDFTDRNKNYRSILFRCPK